MFGSRQQLAPKQQLPFVGHITLGFKSDIVPNLVCNSPLSRTTDVEESVIGSTG